MQLHPHIVLAGGGSLGRLYPGLAIGEQLAEAYPGVDLTFVGQGDDAERHAVLAAGIEYASVPSSPTPRGPLEGVLFATHAAAGYWAARWLLGERDTSLVVGLGGPVSALVVRAAISRGVSVILLEQDAIPSRTARVLGPKANAVCLAFEETKARLPVVAPTVLTGVPVRQEFFVPKPGASHHSASERTKQLLILGGSSARDAEPLNQAVPRALFRGRDDLRGWRVVHQTAPGCLQSTERRYEELGIKALCVTHIDQMPSLLAETDLVVCRPGGSALAELAAVGVPAVLVAGDDPQSPQQTENAQSYAYEGACQAVAASTPSKLAEALATILSKLLTNGVERERMSRAIHSLSRPSAAGQIAQLCADSLGLEQLRAAA